MVHLEKSGDSLCLQLSPNRSATWRQTQIAMAILAGVTLTVATVWSMLGFWLILPFAGLEVGIVYYLGYRVCCATYHQQVVHFRKDQVEVQWGHRFPKKRWVFSRDDAKLQVINPHHSLSAQSLFLKDGTQSVAIADKLNSSDVKEAIACFRAARMPMSFSGQTAVMAKAALPEEARDSLS